MDNNPTTTRPENAVTLGRDPRLRTQDFAALAELEEEYASQIEENTRLAVEAIRKQERDEARQNIEPFHITAYDNIPRLIPVVKRNDVIICSEGNISAVVGEAKSKKTFLCTAMVGSLLDNNQRQQFGIQPNRCKVLWIDTEQSPAHIQKLLFRINILGGLPHNTPDPIIYMAALREASPAERLTIIRDGITAHNPKLVVIDGISDLLTNTNNLEESEALVSQLLALSSIHMCHIMCVLHTNPNSDKARGHLGSTLMRKAESVIYVYKTGEISMVKPQYCRNEPFEPFAFRIEEHENAEFWGEDYVGLGIPVECDPSEVDGVGKEDECVRVLREHFNGCAERLLLANKIADLTGTTINNAQVKIHRAIKKGLLQCKDSLLSIA
jgi:hypothetical protein